MSASPLISIITPSLNQGRFLRACIESVQQQNDPHVEHIVIDGGSSDDTREALNSFPHLVWKSEPDEGQAQAVNKGIALARGEWIGWINADDFYYPGAFQILRQCLQNSPAVDVWTGNYRFVDAEGMLLRERREMGFDHEVYLYGGKSYLANSATFFRKSLFDQFGGLRQNLHHSMDYEFFLRVGRAAKMGHVSEFLASYRLHGESKTARDGARREREMRQIRLEYLSLDRKQTLHHFSPGIRIRQGLVLARRILKKFEAGCY